MKLAAVYEPEMGARQTAAGQGGAGAPVHLVRDTLGHTSLATGSRYLHARPGDSSALYLGAC